MLVDTPLTFSTIQKNNIPMFCSIFYSLWPSEKLGGTQLRGWRAVSLSLSSLYSLLTMCPGHYASNMRLQLLSVESLELFMANKNCIYLNGASNGFSNFTSQLLTVKILCRARTGTYWELGGGSGGWSWDGDLDNEPFLSFPSRCSWRQIIPGPPPGAPGAEETETLAPI